MLDPEAVQAALLAAAGEMQALMNHFGLAAKSSAGMKFGFASDLRAFLRRALQFGQPELVSVDTALGTGILERPTDVVVSARSKVPQLAVELQWHPRGEDHVSFANDAMSDVLKMAYAKATNAVEQAAILLAAPARFWRWLSGFAHERAGYEVLTPGQDTPANTKTDFLSGAAWKFVFSEWPDAQSPERLWTALVSEARVRSPWADVELRLLEVKGLGPVRPVKSSA
ncbi:MAG TPA: hypothetical protein VHI97_00735 [Actinomycetota bacterium]|nr:hypothetical protein [Actinomycetota bacterium]